MLKNKDLKKVTQLVFKSISKISIKTIKAKKNKSYVSKLPRAFVFRCAFDSSKSKV